MSDRFPEFGFQALDSNGDPIAGKLKFFQTLTSTPKSAYSDAAKTSAFTEITADAAGRFGEIFMDTDVAYKVEFTDASDVVIKTWDPVSPVRGSIVTTTPVTAKSANFTVLTTERGNLFEVDASSASVSATLPAAATAGNNFEITIKKVDSSANAVTVDGDGSETIDGATTQTLSDQYDSIVIVCDGTEWHIKAEKDAGESSPLPRSYLAGLRLSNNGTDGDHDIDIGVGTCRDAVNGVNISLSSTLTKRIDASWAAGTNQGGLSSSLTLSASTTYHVHAIVVGGSADVGFDTSVSAANLVTDHSATAYRRIGSIRTDSSSNILAFTQNGDIFTLAALIQDLNANNPGTSAVTTALSVPTGIVVEAMLHGNLFDDSSSGVATALVTSLLQNDVAAGQNTGAQFVMADSGAVDNFASASLRVLTNTARQIRYRLSASDADITFRLYLEGWIDRRGRDN